MRLENIKKDVKTNSTRNVVETAIDLSKEHDLTYAQAARNMRGRITPYEEFQYRGKYSD